MNLILCTICMRIGSQGVRNKNMKLINGKPLMYYTIKQAIKSKIFDNIMVSTDSKQILKYAKSYATDGWFLRSKKLSSNTNIIFKYYLRSDKIKKHPVIKMRYICNILHTNKPQKNRL